MAIDRGVLFYVHAKIAWKVRFLRRKCSFETRELYRCDSMAPHTFRDKFRCLDFLTRLSPGFGEYLFNPKNDFSLSVQVHVSQAMIYNLISHGFRGKLLKCHNLSSITFVILSRLYFPARRNIRQIFPRKSRI